VLAPTRFGVLTTVLTIIINTVIDKYDVCYGATGMVSRAFAIMWMGSRQEKNEDDSRNLQLEHEKKSNGSPVLNVAPARQSLS
jgi:hypothetical protein